MRIFIKAVYAGFMIGIGGIVYLSVENRVVGSLLFSFGLLTIVTQGFYLYTGKIGFVKSWKGLPDMVKSFLAATQKGYAYAMEKPKESAEILWKYAPNYSLDMLVASQEYLASRYQDDSDRWGVMKDEVWDDYSGFLAEYGVIGEVIPAERCYTNEFLP